MKFKTIQITVTALVPEFASEEQISDWVDTKFGECTGECTQLKQDNPCISGYEIDQADWVEVS